MFHELRIYYTFPGKLKELLQRFDIYTLDLWSRLGIKPVGFWTTVIGDDNNILYYMLEWSNLSDRQNKWDVFVNNKEWIKIRKKTEKNGLLVKKIHSQILSPINFKTSDN